MNIKQVFIIGKIDKKKTLEDYCLDDAFSRLIFYFAR